uniref:Uncharacterized protein n=1 Tax=Haptolina ericina TaxID=156174 RepID=A0A7S3FFN4_9EUKA|mmetsp:Transcript_6474/g.14421  ORF Transcript_6474/g.14421 Transcript_6474/m.14421 type:complete len:126 (+) Transcript_6474:378-755(+)
MGLNASSMRPIGRRTRPPHSRPSSPARRSSRYCSGWRASVASGSRARRYRHPYVQLELASAHRHPCGKLVALHLRNGMKLIAGVSIGSQAESRRTAVCEMCAAVDGDKARRRLPYGESKRPSDWS